MIGTIHGAGDGATTFNLPDYRGRFLRGVDQGAGRDPDATGRTAPATGGNTGDTVGSIQVEATKRPNTAFTTDSQGSHTHTAQGYQNNLVGVYEFGGPCCGMGEQGNLGGGGQPFVNLVLNANGAHTHTITGGGDSETRPVNAGVFYIVKL